MLVAQRQRVIKIDLAETDSSMELPLIGVEVRNHCCFGSGRNKTILKSVITVLPVVRDAPEYRY
jgi:hypothetical protein